VERCIGDLRVAGSLWFTVAGLGSRSLAAWPPGPEVPPC